MCINIDSCSLQLLRALDYFPAVTSGLLHFLLSAMSVIMTGSRRQMATAMLVLKNFRLVYTRTASGQS